MMDIDSMIAVLQAAKEGKTIQCRKFQDDDWDIGITRKSGMFNFMDYDYRVKPEPREWRVNIDTKTGGIVWGLPCGPAVVSGVKVREVLP